LGPIDLVEAMLFKKKSTQKPVDPLYTVFEKHLFSFEDCKIDRNTFISNVVEDYLKWLRKSQIAVPSGWEKEIVEELSSQVNTMLIKKIYGFFDITEYKEKKQVPRFQKKQAEKRYYRLKKKVG
jgi:inhibitor of KinA sporulation pathway (predicted exonuclease)